MKNLNKLFRLLPLAVATLLFITVSCTKEGPQGPAGEDGQDGADGNATCGQCHDFSETIKAKMVQYATSLHATGSAFERNGTSCAPCHTSKGFRERIETGLMETAENISNPTPPNCYTCHNIHQSYTADDWTLATAEAVVHWQGGTTFDGGTGNLCANCHQARVTDPFPDAANPGGTYTVSSSRFGPHHGPQSNLLLGVGGYGVSGAVAHPHMNAENTCVTCHMAEAYGSQAGGHNMGAAYDYHGSTEPLTAGCLGCHPDEDGLIEDLEEFKMEMEEDLATLYQMLVDEGIANPETGLANTGDYTNAVAGAYFNYIYLEEEASMGVHNPTYAKDLIEAAMDALSK